VNIKTNDDALVAAALAGDTRAFDALVTRHHGRVLGLLRQLSKSVDVAADLSQETFLQAWKKLGSYQRQDRFGAWLAQIAYRMFLQRHRRNRLEDSVLRHDIDVPSEAIAEPVLVGLPGEQPTMQDLLQFCTLRQQEALYMNYVLELSHEEIARVTGQPIGSVKSHIKRGKVRIRSQLERVAEYPVAVSNE